MANTYFTDIQKLYVTYFARPADPAGLQYWENVVEGAHGSLAAVSAAFAQSAEYKQVTAGMDVYHAVDALYINLFGHDPDLAGLNFWGQGLKNGSFTIDEAAAAIVAGAQGSDLQIFGLKVAAASYFTSMLDTTAEILAYSGANGIAWGKAYLAAVTPEHPYPPLDGPPVTTGPIIGLAGIPAAGPDLSGHGIHP